MVCQKIYSDPMNQLNSIPGENKDDIFSTQRMMPGVSIPYSKTFKMKKQHTSIVENAVSKEILRRIVNRFVIIKNLFVCLFVHICSNVFSQLLSFHIVITSTAFP